MLQADDLGVEDRVLRFDDVGFRTLHEGDDLVVFCLGNIERLQRGVGVFEKDRPITFADTHSPMGERHVTALVVQRAAGAGAEKIHDELPFPLHAIRAAMLPEPAQLGVFCHAVQQIVGDGEDGVITTEAFVEGFLAQGFVSSEGSGSRRMSFPNHILRWWEIVPRKVDGFYDAVLNISLGREIK